MAASSERQRMREVNMRVKIKTEEFNRIKEELEALRQERKDLKEKITSEEATM